MNKKEIIKTQSVWDYCVSKKIKTIAEYAKLLSEKNLKTIDAPAKSGHNYSSKFKASNLEGLFHDNGLLSKNTFLLLQVGRSGIYPTEIAFDVITKNEILDLVKFHDDQRKEYLEKVKIMNDLKIDEYDEKLIKVIQALKSVKKSGHKDALKEAKEFIKTIEN